jgi:imidazolonepropionase-like amidohydrolase
MSLRAVRSARLALAPALIAVACALAAGALGDSQIPTHAASDVAAARQLFQANLDAIRHRDREAYLACYLHSPQLARTGPEGPALSYDSLAANRDTSWPDGFEALDLQLVPVRDGVVYGTYRYRVRYGSVEQVGLSERFFVETPEGWRIAVSTAFPAPPGTPPPPRALVGATLIDGTGKAPVRDAVVLMRNGRIEYAGPRARLRLPAGVDTLDVHGLTVAPGLIDAHVHYSQTGWYDGRPDAADLRDRHPYDEVERRLREHPEAFHRSWLATGVTAVFDVGGYPWTIAMARAAETDTRAPHVSAAGPLISTLDHWLNLPAERQFIYLANDSVAHAGVKYLKTLGSAAVKVWFINNRARDFAEMARLVKVTGDAARAAGLPLIVHATGLREAKAALAAGAKVLVHSVDDSLVDSEFLQMAKRNGTLYCPTLTVREGYLRLYESSLSGRAPAFDDPNGVVDSLTRALIASTPVEAAGRARRPSIADSTVHAKAVRTMAENLRRVRAAGIPIAMGTDAGNPLTLHGPAVYAEMEAMHAAGLTPMQVLVASTRNGAMTMGRGAEFGTLEAGKQADLVVLEGDPSRDVRAWRKLRYVVRGGVVRTPRELRAP